MAFAIPRIWREQRDHLTDCFFCLASVGGKQLPIYPDLQSSRAPVPHSLDIPVPLNQNTEKEIENCSTSTGTSINESECDFVSVKKVSRESFESYSKRLKLSKRGGEEFRKILNEIGVLSSEVTYRSVRSRADDFDNFFTEENGLCFCNNVPDLIFNLFNEYRSSEFLLFIDGSVAGIKAALIKKDGAHFPVLILQWNKAKENYSTLKEILTRLNYVEGNWEICGDFKILQILMGLKNGGNIRHPCFFCLYHAQHTEKETKVDWEERTSFIEGQYSVERVPLINTEKIVLPSLHLKLGLFKQYLKYIPNEKARDAVKQLLPNLSSAKITGGILTGPQIDKIINSETFTQTLTTSENDCRKNILNVFRNVLVPSPSTVTEKRLMVDKMISSLNSLKVNYSPKMHFIDFHLTEFLGRQYSVSDQHGERLHQTLKDFEKRYMNKSVKKMILDYLWMCIE